MVGRAHLDRSVKEHIGHIYTEATNHLAHLECWPSYYRFRRQELELLLHFYPLQNQGVIFELGCGIGYMSAMLSACADCVIAADLPAEDSSVHSRGLGKAEVLLKELGVEDKIKLIGCSGENLPIATASVDTVLSFYVLEHIPLKLRDQVLQEFRRVLRDEGLVIITVPNWIERMYNIPRHYLRMSRRVYRRMRDRLSKDNHHSQSVQTPIQRSHKPKFIEKWGRRIFPHPHGLYSSSVQELVQHFPWIWFRLFKRNGFYIETTFTIEWTVPWADDWTVGWYEGTSRLSRATGDRFPFKYLGQSITIVARK